MSNAGLKLREPANRGQALNAPVIGDELDQETYGRPTGRTAAVGKAAPRARARRVKAVSAVTSPKAVASPKAVSLPSAAAQPAGVYDSGRSRIDADGVRTVKISGQATPPRRRSHGLYDRPIARYDQHPDRAAQWALFLGVFMVVVAIVTGT